MRITQTILVLLLLTSCVSAKRNIKTDTEAQSNVRVDRAETVNTISASTATLDVNNDLHISELKNVSGAYTKWSAPDSTGKQYPVETGSFESNKKAETSDKTKTREQQNNAEISISEASDKSDYKSEARTKIKEKTTTETEAPTGVSWGMIILTMGLLFLLYLLLKKYKIL